MNKTEMNGCYRCRCKSARELKFVFNFFFSAILLCDCFHQKPAFILINAFFFSSKEVTYSRKQRESGDCIIKLLNPDTVPTTSKSISFLLFWHLYVFFIFTLFKTCQHVTHLSKSLQNQNILKINMTPQTKRPLETKRNKSNDTRLKH